MKNVKISLVFFLVLLLLVELGFRFAGYKPGTLDASLYPDGRVRYDPLFQADSLGITAFNPDYDPSLTAGYVINSQGFRSPFDFRPEVLDSLRSINDGKVVFLIGDSYTEGCCTDPIDSSFADLFLQLPNIISLNFGVGCTDLVQYDKILQKYLRSLQPDLVVVNVYWGNDIANHERKLKPYVPVCYPFVDYPCLHSAGHPLIKRDYPDAVLPTPEAALEFYLSTYTLWGKNATSFEKLIRHSVLASHFYLGVVLPMKKVDPPLVESFPEDEFTNQFLHRMQNRCEQLHVPILFVGIPHPMDAKQQVDLDEKYGKYIEGLTAFKHPDISRFSEADYDGLASGNHFNNRGHRVYYHFLSEVVDEVLQAQQTNASSDSAMPQKQ